MPAIPRTRAQQWLRAQLLPSGFSLGPAQPQGKSGHGITLGVWAPAAMRGLSLPPSHQRKEVPQRALMFLTLGSELAFGRKHL